MSNIDKRALREAAEKATPGPWCIARNGKTITSNQSHPVAVITEDFHRMLANGKTGGDAEFISAANPVTVLALLDELEAKDSRNAEQVAIIAKQEKWIKDVEATMIAATDRAEAAERRTITVKLPADYHLDDGSLNADMMNTCAVVGAFREALAAAGITVKGADGGGS